jgi:hypothetical protein
VQDAGLVAGELRADARVDLHEERLDVVRRPRGDVAQARSTSIAMVSSDLMTPSPSHVGHGGS